MIFRDDLTGWSGSEMKDGIHLIRIKPKDRPEPDWPHDERKARKDRAKVRRWERRQKDRGL